VEKKLKALVCGTENKSEHYLGYFTRFGDGASDLEPILGLYKTQVRELAEHLKLPEKYLEKAPSAELWQGQTDEQELGFSYEDADRVMAELIDHKKPIEEIKVEGVDDATVGRIIARVKATEFKHQVPYKL
jgi:NAD+ synthase